MSNNNPFLQHTQSAQTQYSGPQSYVNFTMPASYAAPQNGVFTRFVSSEQEASSMPQIGNGTNFFVDGENLILYAKYADGRPMETFDLVLRQPPKQPEYVTVEDFHNYLDEKFEEFGKRFQLRKDYNRGGQNNG